jgi:hypothetical protein
MPLCDVHGWWLELECNQTHSWIAIAQRSCCVKSYASHGLGGTLISSKPLMLCHSQAPDGAGVFDASFNACCVMYVVQTISAPFDHLPPTPYICKTVHCRCPGLLG